MLRCVVAYLGVEEAGHGQDLLEDAGLLLQAWADSASVSP
jgi:hypothetical protein